MYEQGSSITLIGITSCFRCEVVLFCDDDYFDIVRINLHY